MHHWEAVEAFVEVMKQGSFSAAADRLKVSPSHVSRLVAKLESSLGVPLLYRTTRKLRPSQAGQRYYEQCRRLLEGLVSAEHAISAEAHEAVGPLKVTCATTFGERFIAPVLNELMLQHPRLSLDLHLTNRRVDLIEEGYDLAVRMGAMDDSSMLSRRLCDRREYLCASPAYLERFGMPHVLSELAHHRCLTGSRTRWLFQREGQRYEIRPEASWRSNSGPAQLDAVRRGLGIAQLPDYYVEPDLASGRLVSLLDQYRYPFSGVWLIYPRSRQRSRRLQLLCDALLARFADQVPWREAI
ncbi:LysR family transcriptional regulator [Terasakiispira papahanaumokuakeensis]|uniref:LysR family transcriptional regulator n=1 Tax=Terasakiispira papahanaumokuakeensis TaxID=197479 RepID=A0A1E2V9S7_9GAMM|nr:LysR family transcriptional regulator [Terasakiispira papahanaumokuakeensis]ODC03612.1 LysR family transcriptional regulator [Terasakiispira papahanaumokuakeensis]